MLQETPNDSFSSRVQPPLPFLVGFLTILGAIGGALAACACWGLQHGLYVLDLVSWPVVGAILGFGIGIGVAATRRIWLVLLTFVTFGAMGIAVGTSDAVYPSATFGSGYGGLSHWVNWPIKLAAPVCALMALAHWTYIRVHPTTGSRRTGAALIYFSLGSLSAVPASDRLWIVMHEDGGGTWAGWSNFWPVGLILGGIFGAC